MIINTNITAQVSVHNLQTNQALLGRSLARLSSGSKIVQASEDPAGLAVSSQMTAQLQRLQAAQDNIGDAVSFTQTQDGYLRRVAKALERMSELSLLAQDVTKSDADRQLYQLELEQLTQYIADVATKDFNRVRLFSSAPREVNLSPEGSVLAMEGVPLDGPIYTQAWTARVDTRENAQRALDAIKAAATQLTQDRARIGTYLERLNSTAEQLRVSRENLAAAQLRIQDVDVAAESTVYARQQILVQSGTAMLAQANARPQTALRLLE